MKNVENRIKNIANLINSANKNLRKAQKMLDSMVDEMKSSFDDVPGVLGVFDGIHMIDAQGKKHEVNPNYVAKSMLVTGDNLKMVEEGDKKLFKQVSKVDRKRLAGILNKKEGKWYALTDAGSYRVLDVAIEFRRGEVNDECTVLVPEENLNSEWCALERLAKEDEIKPIAEPDIKGEGEKKEEKPKERVAKKKEPAKKKSETKKTETKKRSPSKPKTTRKTTRKPKEPEVDAAQVNSLLDDDDLR